MEIELYTNLQSHTFEVDKETSDFIKSQLEQGGKFDVLFPDFEPKEDEQEGYTLEIKSEGVYINDILINEDIFQEELVDYKPCDREDEIDMLFTWISECGSDRQSDKELMIEDLRYLQGLNDEWVWSNISTNEFIAKSDDEERFNEICEEILEKNSEYCGELYEKGKLDYCSNCDTYINQIDLGNGSFGCPICKRDDCIETKYDSGKEE